LVPAVLDRHHAGGYTEFDHAHGTGSSGKREGTRVWPGDASIYFSIVPSEHVVAMTNEFRTARAGLNPGERLHVAVLPTETFI
jgi:hypothetical protein